MPARAWNLMPEVDDRRLKRFAGARIRPTEQLYEARPNAEIIVRYRRSERAYMKSYLLTKKRG